LIKINPKNGLGRWRSPRGLEVVESEEVLKCRVCPPRVREVSIAKKKEADQYISALAPFSIHPIASSFGFKIQTFLSSCHDISLQAEI